MNPTDELEFMMFDVEALIEEVSQQAAEHALRAAAEARHRRLVVQGIVSGKAASEIVLGLHRGVL